MVGKSEGRMKSYKKGVDAADGRRRREETRVQLRKSKKEEQLAKRRNASISATVDATNGPTAAGCKNDEPKYTIKDLKMLTEWIQSPATELEAVRGIRRMLSAQVNPPVRQVLEAGAMEPLVAILLSREEAPELQFEALWALTNIASTNFTEQVVQAGVVPPTVKLLMHANPNVREQAAWCLGNVAGDCPTFRDLVLQHGALKAIILNLENPANQSLLSNMVWATSNLFRGKPQPPLDEIRKAFAPIGTIINTPQVSNDILSDALWASSYACDGENARIQAVMETGDTIRLAEILASNDSKLITPALRIVGNFATGSETQTQVVLDAKILPICLRLLRNKKRGIRKETCWLLSNIAAGTPQQIEMLIQNQALLTTIVQMGHSSEWEVRKEALWTLFNIFTTGKESQVRALADMGGAIEAVCNALDATTEPRIVMAALEAIEQFLTVSEDNGLDYNVLVDEFDGITKMEVLQQHQDDEIYQKSIAIIERFYGFQDAEDENLAPTVDGNAFEFGLPAKNLFGPDSTEASANPFDFGGNSTAFNTSNNFGSSPFR